MKKQISIYFLIAFIGHLLMMISFLGFSWAFLEKIYEPDSDKVSTYMPAYVYQPPSPPAQQADSLQSTESKPQKGQSKSDSLSKLATEKQEKKKSPTSNVSRRSDVKPITYSANMQQNSTKSKKTFDDPLLQLLHQATQSKLMYPKIAIDFNESGIVKVGFVVHPNGQITDVTLIKSSGYEILDTAALDTVRNMSPVQDVGLYLKEAKFVGAYISFSGREEA